MAAMAPALTDASAHHPSSFKLPVSPADPGQTVFEATPSDPTSPGLPNGHSKNTNQTDASQQNNTISPERLLETRLDFGGEDDQGSVSERAKIRYFRTTSRGRDTTLYFGCLNEGKATEAFPVSAREPGLTNGGDTALVGYNAGKMNHPVASGIHDKQQPCLSNISSTPAIMPPENLMSESPDAMGSSSTATADSSEAEDEVRDGVDRVRPLDETVTIPQDFKLDYDKVISSVSNDLEGPGGQQLRDDSMSSADLFEPEQIPEVTDQHSKLAQRARHIVQKLRHLQTRHLKVHTQRQIQGFVNEQHRCLDEKALEVNAEGCQECKRNSSPADPPSLASAPTCKDNGAKNLGNSTKDHPTRTCNHKRKVVALRQTDADLPGNIEVKSSAKQLLAKFEHVKSWVDPDETESSSGGESCDEGDDTLPASCTQTRQKHKIPLHRRASWKWAVERSSIASRWTWLQAQVSDLEYRIRQQSDIYRQTRASKGVAILGEPASPEDLMKIRAMTSTISTKSNRKVSPTEAQLIGGGSQQASPSNLSLLLSNVDRQSARLKQSLENCGSPMSGLTVASPTATSTPMACGDGKTTPLSKPMNGIVGNASSHGSPFVNNRTMPSPGLGHKQSQLQYGTNAFPSPPPSSLSALPEEHYCARTRPVWYFRKRKLIRATGVHGFGRKIQKLSTVRCGCCPPLLPCVMCGGKFNHVEKAKEPDVAPINERVAQLDYSYHPVLSFPQDIPLSIQFEGMISSNEWQRKPPPSKLSVKKKRQSSTATEQKEVVRTKRKYERKKDKGKTSTADDKSIKMLRKLAAQTMKHAARGDSKLLKRSNSKANSLPGTPKNLLTDELSRRCRTDIKKRRAAQLAIAALKKTRARSLSLPNIEDHLHLDGSNLTSVPGTPTAMGGSGDGTHYHQMSHSMPSGPLQNFLKPRRPGAAGGSSDQYDIDNIVIPYSMLASTRVEKLEYKEIMTPKWRRLEDEEEEKMPSPDRNHLDGKWNHQHREMTAAVMAATAAMAKDVVDVKPTLVDATKNCFIKKEIQLDDERGEYCAEGKTNHREERENHVDEIDSKDAPKLVEKTEEKTGGEEDEEEEEEEEGEDEEEEEGEENLSDSEIVERHAKCEIKERQKYLTILANQTHIPHHRRGARRSRNNSQGGTPEPYSPDTNLFDQTQPSSSLTSSNPSSPLTTQDALSPTGGAMSLGTSAHRLRTSSFDKRRTSNESSLDSSMGGIFEELGYVENPWPMRSFPLDDAESESLGAILPEVVMTPTTSSTTEGLSTVIPLIEPKTEDSSTRSSPLAEAMDESSGPEEIEDPNDPEWTVVSPDKQRSSIVLRLAKR